MFAHTTVSHSENVRATLLSELSDFGTAIWMLSELLFSEFWMWTAVWNCYLNATWTELVLLTSSRNFDLRIISQFCRTWCDLRDAMIYNFSVQRMSCDLPDGVIYLLSTSYYLNVIYQWLLSECFPVKFLLSFLCDHVTAIWISQLNVSHA